MVHITPEEQNSTETTKTYKVSCDKRNTTGIDKFTVQVLNASQVCLMACEARWLRGCSNTVSPLMASPLNVMYCCCFAATTAAAPAVTPASVPQDLMEFLNANSTECSVVLFFTTWCQFSANLAPHFNALPRVFPSMHFLALDASQHSR